MAVCLLKEGKRSLRDIAQTTNVPKSTLCRICKFLRENNKIGLEMMLNLSKVKGGAQAKRLIFAGKRDFAVGKDSLKYLIPQIALDC